MTLQFVIAYASCLISVLLLDVTWLSMMYKGFYRLNLNHLLSGSPKYVPIIFFYLLYPLGATILVIMPALGAHYGLSKIYFMGAILGLVAYGTYDLTNEATLKNWPTIVTAVDMVWGSFLTGGVCLISAYITKFINGAA